MRRRDEEANELLAAAPDNNTLEAWLRRRERGEPLAWITGTMQFCGHTLRVDPGVYVPRFQSEELARREADVQRYEPRLALDGGGDGLGLVRRVVGSAARLLRPGGWLLAEVGGEQDQALSPTLAASGFHPATPWVRRGRRPSWLRVPGDGLGPLS